MCMPGHHWPTADWAAPNPHRARGAVPPNFPSNEPDKKHVCCRCCRATPPAQDDWPAAGARESIAAFRLPATLELLATGAADPQEHAWLAAQLPPAAAGAAGAAGGSAAARPGAAAASSGAAATPLARRLRAERERARALWDRVARLGQCGRSINALLEYMVSRECGGSGGG